MAALRFFFYLLMKPAALGFAFLGLAGILAPYLDPNIWWLPAFSGLFMPILIFANLFLLLYWGIHKRWWVLFPLVTLAANYQFYVSMFQSPWKESVSYCDQTTFKVASYNVEGFYWISKDHDYKNISKYIKENNIDIICFQEHCEESLLDSNTIYKRIGLPFRAVYFNRKTDWANFGISIYSRYPIIRSGKIDFHSEKNSSMWADIFINKDTIRIFNNHLQTTDVSPNTAKYNKYKSVKNWKGQARTLVHILEQLKRNFQVRAQQAIQVRQIIDTTTYPCIICGDFNDTPVSFAFNHIAHPSFKDGFIDRGKGYGHSFNGIKGLLRIDFIAYQQPYFKGVEYTSPHLPWSDHNPVVMSLTNPSGPLNKEK